MKLNSILISFQIIRIHLLCPNSTEIWKEDIKIFNIKAKSILKPLYSLQSYCPNPLMDKKLKILYFGVEPGIIPIKNPGVSTY